MGKKVPLPLFGGGRAERPAASPAKKPSLEHARARLGGPIRGGSPAPSGLPPGRVVRVRAGSKPRARGHVGVVVFADASEVHVLASGMRLLCVAHDAVDPFEGDAPIELAKIAADAHVFGTLAEGQPVRYADDATGLLGGKLVEKCRYGALVVRDDGTVVAVGFRKLWPATSAGAG